MSLIEQTQNSLKIPAEEIDSQNEKQAFRFSRRELGKRALQTMQKAFSQSRVSGNELLAAGGEIILGSSILLGLSERTNSEENKELLQKAGTVELATGFIVFETGMTIRSLKNRADHTSYDKPIQTVLQRKTTRLPRRYTK